LREVGVIASNARSFEAPLLIYKEAEPLIKEEALVLVDDVKFRKKYLGVLRFVVKLDPLLTTTQRSAIIERPEIAEEGIDIPYETSTVRIIGEVSGSRVEPATTPPTPRSKVYLVEKPEDLLIDLGTGLSIGVHKYSGIEVPMRTDALRYHIAVVGTTGTGKSRLVKAVIDEVIAKTNWNVIVFDHTGMDYAPYWPDKTVAAERVVLDVATIADGLKACIGTSRELIEEYIPPALAEYVVCEGGNTELCNKLQSLRQKDTEERQRGKGLVATQKTTELPTIERDVLEALTLEVSSRGGWNASKLAIYIARVALGLGAKATTNFKLTFYLTLYAQHYIRRLNSMRYRVDDLVDRARRDRLLVVDLSTVETEVRRVIVARFLERLWEIITERLEPVNTLVVIDEAHNYACYQGCYPASYMVEKTLREGRKWNLGVVLASQRVLDFSPDVRNNVNTVFFSRLQTPYDFDQLRNFVDLAGIRPETLSLLEAREFFFAGLGNPLKFPMLIRVREVGDPARVPS